MIVNKDSLAKYFDIEDFLPEDDDSSDSEEEKEENP